jgi:outer membrane receptor protein involved in Fe transport
LCRKFEHRAILGIRDWPYSGWLFKPGETDVPMRYNQRSITAATVALTAIANATPILAHTPPNELEETLIIGRRLDLTGTARSASEGVAGAQDLALRPLLRPGDLLEAVPGMIVTQHSGSGKSNQMFLRGFNLDHGTDFATSVDGMPVNMRSHGHGQGYTDINFLIPETVAHLRFVKGPYHAELGDFSSAGGAQFTTHRQVEHNLLQLGVGENGYQRLLAMGDTELAEGQLFGAAELQWYDGPWRDIEEDVDKTNGMLRYSKGHWQVTAMAYDNSWNAADQIPQRAVEQGLIDELGSIDTTLGGETSRYSLSAEGKSANAQWSAYLIDYELQLWSNFTYLLDDPIRGDQFEQRDDRLIAGGNSQYRFNSGANEQMQHRLGLTLRHDDIDTLGLYRTRARQRVGTVREDSVAETSIGLFYELDWQLTDKWRGVFGLRGDYYHFDVDAEVAQNSGEKNDNLVSPKVSLIYSAGKNTEVYASAGYGFHSNDARGTTQHLDPVSGDAVEPVDPLVRSRGAELGFKTQWQPGWISSLALWYLELDSELLFVGDAGITEATGASRRHGVEFNNHWSLTPTLAIEADFAWTDAEYQHAGEDGDNIPGALDWVTSAALTYDSPNSWYAALRLRYFDDAPLIEDGSVSSDSSLMANATLGWRHNHWELRLDALNLFDSDDNDIAYFYASRLPGEPAAGVEDIHAHVFEPRQLRAYVSYRF